MALTEQFKERSAAAQLANPSPHAGYLGAIASLQKQLADHTRAERELLQEIENIKEAMVPPTFVLNTKSLVYHRILDSVVINLCAPAHQSTLCGWQFSSSASAKFERCKNIPDDTSRKHVRERCFPEWSMTPMTIAI